MSTLSPRRDFLQQLGALGGCGVLAAYAPRVFSATPIKPPGGIAGSWRYGLMLGPGGTLDVKNVEARYLTPSFTASESRVGTQGPQRVTLLPRPPEFEVTLGLSAGPAVWPWINAALAGRDTPINGAIDMIAPDSRITSRVNFLQATLTEVHLSKLNAAARSSLEITIVFSAASAQLVTGSGAAVALPRVASNTRMGNFQVSIDQLDTQHITEVTWPEIRFERPTQAVGAARQPSRAAAVARVGPLRLGLQLSGAAGDSPFVRWLNDAVRGGTAARRMGKIAILDDSRRTEMLSCNLRDLLPVSVSIPKFGANAGELPMLAAEMNVGGMEFVQRA